MRHFWVNFSLFVFFHICNLFSQRREGSSSRDPPNTSLKNSASHHSPLPIPHCRGPAFLELPPSLPHCHRCHAPASAPFSPFSPRLPHSMLNTFLTQAGFDPPGQIPSSSRLGSDTRCQAAVTAPAPAPHPAGL